MLLLCAYDIEERSVYLEVMSGGIYKWRLDLFASACIPPIVGIFREFNSCYISFIFPKSLNVLA